MDAREANVLVHSKMAASYNEREPHFRPENRAKVRRVLESLRREFGGRLLDVGCGTGFIIDLAEDLFDDICGIDITPAMLARVRAGRANIRTVEADASALPFEDERFDVVSGYSFFHHLEHLAPAVQEVHRVLRPGGCFYADLEPNRHFWDNVTSVKPATDEATPRLTLDEISSVCHTDEKVAREYGIAPEVFNLAEYNKAVTGGIHPEQFAELLRTTGFHRVTVSYEWFAGQGKVLHGVSPEAAETVDNYLRNALPLSRGMYKYLKFLAVRS
jgi:ubiquinone/menaquinone biosynthesis C-methylase UbiE